MNFCEILICLSVDFQNNTGSNKLTYQTFVYRLFERAKHNYAILLFWPNNEFIL